MPHAISKVVHTPFAPGDQRDRLLEAYTPLMEKYGFYVAAQTPQSITWTRSARSGWVIAVCILLFPIGLLALLAPKQTTTVTMSLEPEGDGTKIVIAGSGQKQLKELLEGL